jgi:hypothetical protein
MQIHFLSFGLVLLAVAYGVYLVLRITLIRIVRAGKVKAAQERGQQQMGTVVSSEIIGSGKLRVTKVVVEFLNFAQTLVREEFKFSDTKPEERRYEVGKRVPVIIDTDSKNGPTAKLYGSQPSISAKYRLFSAVLIGLMIYGLWQLYLVTSDKIDGDWSQVSVLFENNASMPLMGFIFLGTILFQALVFTFIQKLTKTGSDNLLKELKFYGKKASATITGYADTNMSINNNPVVRFSYTFEDQNGKIQSGEDKVVVGKLEVGSISGMKEKEVYFLPESPEKSILSDNFKSAALPGCLNAILMLEALIFSGVIVGVYLASIL